MYYNDGKRDVNLDLEELKDVKGKIVIFFPLGNTIGLDI